jgi:hypothetical protein
VVYRRDLDPDLGPAIHVELYTDLRDKVEMTMSGGAQARQILNGDRGWIVSPAGTVALAPDQLSRPSARTAAAVTHSP